MDHAWQTTTLDAIDRLGMEIPGSNSAICGRGGEVGHGNLLFADLHDLFFGELPNAAVDALR